jgi:hypothetical protein
VPQVFPSATQRVFQQQAPPEQVPSLQQGPLTLPQAMHFRASTSQAAAGSVHLEPGQQVMPRRPHGLHTPGSPMTGAEHARLGWVQPVSNWLITGQQG